MIFAHHLFFLKNSDSEISRFMYNFIFNEGHIGVSFFFILSGFILAYNYQDGILKKTKSKKKFYIARFARIYPLHILTFIISIPIIFLKAEQDRTLLFWQGITNISLTQSFIPLREIYFSFNSPSWSISNEMFFYITFPFLIIFLKKSKKNILTLLFLFLTLITLIILIVPKNYYQGIFYVNPLIRIIDFIIGIVIFNIYSTILKGQNKIRYNLLEVTSIIILIIFFLFHQYISPVARYSFYYWIPMSYLIFSFSFQSGKISKFLSKKIFLLLGEISFSFYMFHQLIITYFHVINSKFIFIESDIAIAFITFIISVMTSYYSFKYFEKPMNSLIKNILNIKTTANNGYN
jgi:peptidoglycan/LPS O-acetylase OafA/YrhL